MRVIGRDVSHPPPQYIADSSGLRTLCRQLGEKARFALDTEFVGEDSFVPRLELIQVAADDLCAVIDFPAIGSLESFGDLLHNPSIEKVVHAGRQDLELFYSHTGRVPGPIFDTQMAAAMVGYGTQVAYAHLVQRILGTKLDKSHTLSNWSQRPLSREQIAYASEDVQFLLPVYEHLSNKLESLGRTEWVREEFMRLGSKLSEGSQAARLRYQRIRGWDNLKPRAAAALRELVAWREEEARRRNVPRGRIVRDEVLLELARRTPSTLSLLRATRGLHPSEVERNGEAILAAIRTGLALPQADWPEIPRTSRPEPEAAGLTDLLQAVLKARAVEMEIAPGLLASSADLQALVEAKQDRMQLDFPILNGWRRELAGEALLDVIEGRTLVSVDPQSGRLTLTSAD
ncbi:MAG: ribonuclease D [Nitrospirae bacterium]|nr:MAG: ribonuclease D [Nitrospirota bacterium]